MGFLVSNGSTCMCSFGTCPSVLTFLPVNMVNATTPAAVITDVVLGVNIKPFGACAVKYGLPCTFAPAGTWLPTKPNVTIKGKPVLTTDGPLMCALGGVIKILVPGQFTVTA